MILVKTNISDPSFVLHFNAVFEKFSLVDERFELILLRLQHLCETIEDFAPISPFNGSLRCIALSHSIPQNRKEEKNRQCSKVNKVTVESRGEIASPRPRLAKRSSFSPMDENLRRKLNKIATIRVSFSKTCVTQIDRLL